jgi:putative hydrolase of the HAD superfamily
MAPLKAVAFDIGDTLVEYEGVPLNWEAHYPAALRELARHLCVPCTAEQLDRACAVLRRYNTRLNPRTHEVAFAQIARELAPCLGVNFESCDELPAAMAFFRIFRQRLRCFPDTRPAFATLRARGLKIGAFTDVPYGMPRELVLDDLGTAGLAGACDVLLTSRDAGFRKPAAVTLQRLAESLGCEAGEIIHVGNERKDIDVARAFGCRAILLDRTGHRPNWGQDRTIGSLAEL